MAAILTDNSRTLANHLLARKVKSGLWTLQSRFYLLLVRAGYALRRVWDQASKRCIPVQSIYYFSESNCSGREYAKYYVQALDATTLLARVSSRDASCPQAIKQLLRLSETDHVAIFVLKTKGKQPVKVAIDAHDSPSVTNQSIYNWCDVYFKSNYWTSLIHDAKVVPIINGNGLLDHLRLRHLSNLRNVKKDIDVSCVLRIWAGPSFDPWHCLRLLEKVNQLPCKKYILAVFCGFHCDDTSLRQYLGFCSRNRIPYSLDPIDYNQLLDISSRSQIVVIRNGVSSCIPWRFLDMLCAGVCVAFDHEPVVSWPEPLIQGQHFLSMNIFPSSLRQQLSEMGQPVNGFHDRNDPDRLESYLGDNGLLQKIRSSAISYYLAWCSPYRLGCFIASKAIETCAQ